MKKLKLKALELGAKEVLSRAQLKNVLGGSGSGSGSGNLGTCTVTVTCLSKTTISCSGSGAACHYQNDSWFTPPGDGWVQCDKDPKISCK